MHVYCGSKIENAKLKMDICLSVGDKESLRNFESVTARFSFNNELIAGLLTTDVIGLVFIGSLEHL